MALHPEIHPRTAREHDIERTIRFHHRVRRASWSSQEARWTVEVERGADKEPARLTCNFLIVCSGYYSYAEGYTPALPGIARFEGRIVHPQNWTEDVVYANKRVVVIGSGATAVTLVPELAKAASHVTMLQRSPTYVVAWPDEDRIANALRRWLPARAACSIARWKNVLAGMYFYRICKRDPERAKAMIRDGLRAELGPDYDIATHFTPRYDPWDQRLCLAPNGDFFHAIRSGKTTIVTDEIETFTKTGLKLRSGRELEADLVVTATGLNLQVLGGAEIDVDGKPADPATTLSYKGVYVQRHSQPGVGVRLHERLVDPESRSHQRLRLPPPQLHGAAGPRQCTPRNSDPTIERRPPVDFTSGYFQRSMDKLPRQGSRKPWRIYQNYIQDLIALRLAPHRRRRAGVRGAARFARHARRRRCGPADAERHDILTLFAALGSLAR